MALTVTERKHWKERIAKRIDKAISNTYCVEDPALLKRTSLEAKQLAAESLGLAPLQKNMDRINKGIKQLEKEKLETLRRQLAVVRGCDVSDVEVSGYGYSVGQDVINAISEAARQFETELLGKDPLGRKVLDLREEKDCLLDTVWLATSGKQIKELWTKVSAKLNQEPTALQSAALRIEASEES